MTINLSVPEPVELHPRITVVGVGGAGGNAVNNMIDAQLGGVDFVALNTDSQSLAQSLTDRRIQLGANVTQGLGAGSNPDIGRRAAEESLPEIIEMLTGSHMVFITAGMGGGTGSGASPLVAQAARESGILTVGVVTKPFQFEGAHRMAIAEAGTEALENCVDTLIIIPNQNLFRVANDKTTFADAFKMADDVLYSGVRSVTDLMVMPGLINLDFADVRSIMMEMGKAMMGTGEADGERRAIEAAESAISNPLLDDVSMRGAKGVLINITGGPDMTLYEVDEAANRIRDEVDPDANIIFGSIFDAEIEGRLRVSVVATGIEHEQSMMPTIHTLYPHSIKPSSKYADEKEQKSQEPQVSQGHAPLRQEPSLSEAQYAPNVGEGVTLAERPLPNTSLEAVGENGIRAEVSLPTFETSASEGSCLTNNKLDDLNDTSEKNTSEMPAASPAYSQTPVMRNVSLDAYARLKIETDSERSNEISSNESTPSSFYREGEKIEDKPFLPPPPVDPSGERKTLNRPEPFAEAAIANARGEVTQQKTKGASLFQRISSAGRRRDEKIISSGQATPKGSTNLGEREGHMEPKLDRNLGIKETESTNSDSVTNSQSSASIKKSIGATLNTEHKIVSNSLENPSSQFTSGKTTELAPEPSQDLLDIPAFLRRQAN